MDLKTLLAIFGTVFLAELGDKTQLATVLFASNRANSALLVFCAASFGLVAACAIGVLAGSLLSQHVNTRHLSIVAGVGFIAIGAWTLWSALRGAG
jgi:putative Ca2+/H+ antiporter (TMEM165/GDT1 family)